MGSERARSARAVANVRRFRKGLFLIGILPLLYGVFVAFTLSSNPFFPSSVLVLGVMMAVSATLGAIPIAVGLAFRWVPKAAWYAGMALVAILLLLSLIQAPVGLLFAAVYGVLGYFGVTGKPALGYVYGSPSSDSSGRPGSSTSEPTGSTGSRGAGVDSTETMPTPGSSDLASADTEDSDYGLGETESAATVPDSPASRGGETAAPGDAVSAAPPQVSDDVAESGVEDAKQAESGTGEAPGDDEAEPDPLAEYREGLTASDPETRVAAVRDVADAVTRNEVSEQAALDALGDRLDDDAVTVRKTACEVLGDFRSDRARSMLGDLRLDPASEVSRAATRALADNVN